MPDTIEGLTTTVFTIPTDRPESDGTMEWNTTTLVLAQVTSGNRRGIGYSYAAAATARVIDDMLTHVVIGRDPMSVAGAHVAMSRALRNAGRPGIGSHAIAAVDVALWDLKARLLERPLATLLGQCREAIPAYGSGGFTSYTLEELRTQLGDWASAGLRSVKMKVGREPERDLERVRVARDAIGGGTSLFVDANGAHGRPDARAQATRFGEYGVTWFEEPVSSDDLEGLRELRSLAPPGMAIVAGEYGYDSRYFRRMLEAGAVDVLQADLTRCGGITGFLEVGALCASFGTPLSAHTAAALHAAPCCAIPAVRNVEYFHDHARIESMLFEGGPRLSDDGCLRPDLTAPGLGLTVKWADAERFRVDGSE